MAHKDGTKSGGRQKGTSNKLTRELRDTLKDFTIGSADEAIAAFHRIGDPEKKFALWLKALEFNVPKLTSIELKDEIPVKTYKEELDEMELEDFK